MSGFAITPADILNDRVLPFFEEHQVPLLRILTDRGTEYKGKPEHHGICERLHRTMHTMQEEFYAVVSREKLYNNLEEMQKDLDEWMKYYNQDRAHSGRYCYGKTPMETFKESHSLNSTL